MPKFVVIHGSLKVGAHEKSGQAPHVAHQLETVELDEKATAPHVADGTLLTEGEWQSALKEAEARAELEAKRAAMGNDKPLPSTLAGAIEAYKKKLQASKPAEKAAPAKTEPEAPKKK